VSTCLAYRLCFLPLFLYISGSLPRLEATQYFRGPLLFLWWPWWHDGICVSITSSSIRTLFLPSFCSFCWPAQSWPLGLRWSRNLAWSTRPVELGLLDASLMCPPVPPIQAQLCPCHRIFRVFFTALSLPSCVTSPRTGWQNESAHCPLLYFVLSTLPSTLPSAYLAIHYLPPTAQLPHPSLAQSGSSTRRCEGRFLVGLQPSSPLLTTLWPIP
jgi:hypothetical protein